MAAIWAVRVVRETIPAAAAITLGRVRDIASKSVIAYARIASRIQLLESEAKLEAAINSSVIFRKYEEQEVYHYNIPGIPGSF